VVSDSESEIDDDLNPEPKQHYSDDESENESGEESEDGESESVGSEENKLEVSDKPAVWRPAFKNREEGSSVALEAEKLIRAVLNKVSEGNIDPMFQELSKVLE
jgi:hypothetical protein